VSKETGGAIVDHNRVAGYARNIKHALDNHSLVFGVVVGGGNVYRGRRRNEILNLKTSVYTSDYMGLLATVINGLALEDILTNHFHVPTKLFSPLVGDEVADTFRPRLLEEYKSRYKVMIFTGTGVPAIGRSSDSVASEVALQLRARRFLKATKVDGVYDRDPEIDPENAVRLDRLDYAHALRENLDFMDETALRISMTAGLSLRVFSLDPDDHESLSSALDFNVDIGSTIEV